MDDLVKHILSDQTTASNKAKAMAAAEKKNSKNTKKKELDYDAIGDLIRAIEQGKDGFK